MAMIFLANLNPGDLLSLGQLIVDILLIPIVIIGFYITLKEFRSNQLTPNIEVYWEHQNENLSKFTELSVPTGEMLKQTKRLMIRNEGNTVTLWYLIRLEIPRDLFNSKEPKIDRLVGNTKDLIGDDTHWKLDSQPEKYLFTFMSNGLYALYPNYPLPICRINFFFDGDMKLSKQLIIPYIVFTDKGKEKRGELVLLLTRPKFARPDVL